jgi:hypothetical protein
MTTFSKRYGYGPQGPTEPIIEDAPSWLRTKYIRVLNQFTYVDDDYRYKNTEGCPLGIKYLNETISELLRRESGSDARDSWTCQDYLEGLIKSAEWHCFYGIVERVGQEIQKVEQRWKRALTSYPVAPGIDERIQNYGYQKYLSQINELFAEENIGWRLDKDCLLKRESPKDLSERLEKIAETLTDEFEPARDHYRKAVRFANARPLDPENSIKEIISAVESVGRVLYPGANTLGDVVKDMRKQNKFPQLLIIVIEKFYAYTCSEPAVRHGGPVSSRVLSDDAEFCLHMGAALIRYMIAYSKRRI